MLIVSNPAMNVNMDFDKLDSMIIINYSIDFQLLIT
jgi:hypothetical protein